LQQRPREFRLNFKRNAKESIPQQSKKQAIRQESTANKKGEIVKEHRQVEE
jgi:hypothetical protein